MSKGSKTVAKSAKATPPRPKVTDFDEATFAEISKLISDSRAHALLSVNTVLIDLYWNIGEIISRKISAAEWGDGVVAQLAGYIARTQPALRGFTRSNLFRMRQFYETYREDKKVAPLVRQLPWSHHLIILGQSKRPEEREFYLRIAVQERWSKRELERQVNSALFARVVLSPPKVSPAVRQLHPEALSIFKDAYNLEFLGLPQIHAEVDLHRALLDKLRNFLIELGRDFCFVGSEYPLQVGGRDFALDLLFFHRGLNALVAIELKISEFRSDIPPNRSSNAAAQRWSRLFPKQKLRHVAHVMGPTLVALAFAGVSSGVAHAQGTMDFSGAQTLMGTFKTFAIYAGAIICFGGLIFDGIRMMSGRFQDAIPGLFGALFGAGVLGWGAGWIGPLTGQSM